MKYFLWLFFNIFIFVGCNISQSSPSYEIKKVNPRLINDANIVGWTRERIADFVKSTYNENIFEIQLGKLASGSNVSEDLHDFVNRIIIKHTESVQRLTVAAKDLEIMLPAPDTSLLLNIPDSLKLKKGKEFELEYLKILVKSQERLIKELEEAQSKITEPSLKSWIDFNLPLYTQHLRDAKRLLEKME